MSSLAVMPRRSEIEYPEFDGNPMSDNTAQFCWITTIQGSTKLTAGVCHVRDCVA